MLYAFHDLAVEGSSKLSLELVLNRPTELARLAPPARKWSDSKKRREPLMTKRQRVFFRIGAWACIVTSVIHMAGQLGPRPAPANETEATLFKLMSTYQKDVGAGMLRTTSDFLNGFSVSFSVLLAWIGIVSVLILRRHRDDAAFMSKIARVCALFAAGLLAVSIIDFFLPPTVCVGVIFVGFAGAAFGTADRQGAGAAGAG
jgi:hypothetical protein